MKNIFRFLMAVAILFTASCAKEDISSSIAGGEVEVTFTANLAGIGTRAIADGTTVDRVYVAIFDATSKTHLSELTLPEGYPVSNGQASMTVVLLKDKKYDLVFWAQKDGTGAYTLDLANRKVKANYGAEANNEARDAFFRIDNNWVAGVGSTTFELRRPFAQINAGNSDADVKFAKANGSVISQSSMTVITEIYDTLDLTDGSLTGNEVAAEFTLAAIPSQTIAGTVDPTHDATLNASAEYNYLAMNYLLVNDRQLVDLVFNYTDGTTTFERKYFQVPVQRNYRTNILGQLISSPMDFNVVILPGFDGEEVVTPWDGESVTEPDYDSTTQTYTVDSGSDLAWLAQLVNGTLGTRASGSLKGQTIVLTEDIDLGGNEWTPIGNAAIFFEGTFDGNGKTISNFVVTKQEGHAGLFGYTRSTIKNVNVEGVKIVAHHYAGAIVGQGYARIENCHVDNVNITLTTKNGDLGDKAGGIVGQNCEGGLYVKNSSANNVTITGYRDLGGIAGMAHNNNTVSGCSVNNINIYQDLSVNYEKTTPVTLDAVVGRKGTNVTVENNTVGAFKIYIDGKEQVRDENGNFCGIGSIIELGGQKAVVYSIENGIKAVSVDELNLNGKKWQDAVDWAKGLGTGWALASIYELDEIHAVRAALNDALEANSAENALFCETDYWDAANRKYATYISSTEAIGTDPQGETYVDNRVHLKYFNLNGYWDYPYSTFATISKGAPLRNNNFARAVYTKPEVGTIVECAGQKAVVFSVENGIKAVSVAELNLNGKNWQNAMDWGKSLGTGWALASMEELNAIYDVRVALNNALKADNAENALFWEGDEYYRKNGSVYYVIYLSSTEVPAGEADANGNEYFDNRVFFKIFNKIGYSDVLYSAFDCINKAAPLRDNYFARGVFTLE